MFDDVNGKWTFHTSTPSATVVVPLEDTGDDLVSIFKKRRRIMYDEKETWPVLIPSNDGAASCGVSDFRKPLILLDLRQQSPGPTKSLP